MRTLLIPALILAGVAAPGVTTAENPCPDQPVHTYHALLSLSNGHSASNIATNWNGNPTPMFHVTLVADSNASPCNGGTAADWDGDYDTGVWGAFFGYGNHAVNDECGYDLNVHGDFVQVYDDVHDAFGPPDSIPFLTAENDQSGPIMLAVDSDGDGVPDRYHCETPGGITPSIDSDDCISDADSDLGNGYTPYVGAGSTCGSGGGDGGYWVFLVPPYQDGTGALVGSPPTSGIVIAW